MKNVLILGSGPKANWPQVDIAYCANASIGFYEKELRGISGIVNVVSSRILNISRLACDNTVENIYTSKLDAICNAIPDKLILLESSASIGLSQELIPWLRSIGYKSKIEIQTSAVRKNLHTKLTGLPYPISFDIVTGKPFIRSLKDALYLLRYRFGPYKGEVSNKFRPSTGIISLITAIHEHGNEAKYYLAGIGLSERNLHQINGKLIDKFKNRNESIYEPHVAADRIIVKALAKKYSLYSDNKVINELL